MKKIISETARKSLAMFTVLMLVFGTFGAIIPTASAAEGDVTVTINKYIEGAQATALSANSTDFPMSATWSADNIGAGTGSYALGAANAIPYEAMTIDMSSGADYATSEILDGAVVGASCEGAQPFALVGYTFGDTLAEAAAGTPSLVSPSFVDITTSKFVIVWNHDCSVVEAPATVQVTIHKYIDGEQASVSSGRGDAFPMSATWNDATGIGAGTGEYELNNSSSPVYQAATGEFNAGTDYSTNEVIGGAVVGADCTTEQPFALVGYTSGDSLAEAAAATPSLTVPSFTGLTSNKYVIVWNHDCSQSTGEIGGDVSGGSSLHGTLGVTSIESTDTSATANGTFADGWKYTFHITVPDNETNLAMKFADWFNASGPSSIAAGGNMRISSAEADNAGATVLITAANTYSLPALHMTGDLDLGMPGLQIAVLVEVAVPTNTVNGSYTTSYGVQTLP